MIGKLLDTVKNSDSASTSLKISLIIILLFILFMMPTFDPGPELAAFLATFAIIILSVLSSHYSEERTELIREQNELVESQMHSIEALEVQTREQIDILQDLKSKLDEGWSDRNGSESNEDNNTSDRGEEKDESTDEEERVVEKETVE